MKKILYLLMAALLLPGCSNSKLEMKVSKNYVSWKNGTIQFRTYTHAEGVNFNGPAFEVILKKADGKKIHMPVDSYALGYGASSPMGELGFYKPQKLAKAEILIKTDEMMIIHLSYEPWMIFDEPITLDKQITIYNNSPILKIIDYYTGNFELLNVATGMTTASVGTVKEIKNGFSIDYPYGVTSVIVMPDSQEQSVNQGLGTVLLKKEVVNNEPRRYYIGISDKGETYLLDELDKIL